MALSSEQIYNDLNGSDVLEILLARCQDLLKQVPDFRPTITLPRVRMTISIRLEVYGRTPPEIKLADDLIVRMRNTEPQPTDEHAEFDMETVVNTNPDSGDDYQPPDLVREEHGLPIMTPVKGPFGMEDKPVVRDGQKYARWVEQDYGPMRSRTGAETPVVGGEIIAEKNGGGGRTDIPPDRSRVTDPNYVDQYRPGDVNYKG